MKEFYASYRTSDLDITLAKAQNLFLEQNEFEEFEWLFDLRLFSGKPVKTCN